MFTFATFIAHMSFLAGMNDKMQCQLFFTLECFQTNCADKWPFWIVRLLVARQMIFAFQCRIADITNKPKSTKINYYYEEVNVEGKSFEEHKPSF